eukprot:4766336-Amphidinium_carterae.1
MVRLVHFARLLRTCLWRPWEQAHQWSIACLPSPTAYAADALKDDLMAWSRKEYAQLRPLAALWAAHPSLSADAPSALSGILGAASLGLAVLPGVTLTPEE